MYFILHNKVVWYAKQMGFDEDMGQ